MVATLFYIIVLHQLHMASTNKAQTWRQHSNILEAILISLTGYKTIRWFSWSGFPQVQIQPFSKTMFDFCMIPTYSVSTYHFTTHPTNPHAPTNPHTQLTILPHTQPYRPFVFIKVGGFHSQGSPRGPKTIYKTIFALIFVSRSTPLSLNTPFYC